MIASALQRKHHDHEPRDRQNPAPQSWKKQVRSAVLHDISLAQYAAACTTGWAADSANARVRWNAELDQANQELLLLREEIRIKDARLARVDPPCAQPWALVGGKPGQRFGTTVTFHAKRRHLPIVTLKRAA